MNIIININFAYFGIISLIFFALVHFAMPVVAPFALAFVIAWLMRRPVLFLRRKLHLPDNGIKHSILVALLIAIFDILPVLGTGGVMIPWTILTAIQGNFRLAIELSLLCYLNRHGVVKVLK